MTPARPGRVVVSRLRTEFGRVLATLVNETPGAVAAVLTDEEGDAIDYAHDRTELSELDVQLLGAQVQQAVLALDRSAKRHRLREPMCLLETEAQKLVAGAVGEQYVMALLLEERANVARGLSAFRRARRLLTRML